MMVSHRVEGVAGCAREPSGGELLPDTGRALPEVLKDSFQVPPRTGGPGQLWTFDDSSSRPESCHLQAGCKSLRRWIRPAMCYQRQAPTLLRRREVFCCQRAGLGEADLLVFARSEHPVDPAVDYRKPVRPDLLLSTVDEPQLAPG